MIKDLSKKAKDWYVQESTKNQFNLNELLLGGALSGTLVEGLFVIAAVIAAVGGAICVYTHNIDDG